MMLTAPLACRAQNEICPVCICVVFLALIDKLYRHQVLASA